MSLAPAAKRLLLSGLAWAARRRMGRAFPILCYHSIDEIVSRVSTPPGLFRAQMEHLARIGWRGISMAELWEGLSAGRGLPARCVGITFDDALASFRDQAMPCLATLGFRATLFVPTAHVGGLAAWNLPEGLPEFPILGWGDLAELARAGVDVEPHGVTHVSLDRLSDDDLRREVVESRREIEEKLAPLRHPTFCYPYGLTSPAGSQALAAAGYRGAVTVELGSFRLDDDPFRIKRQGMTYTSAGGPRDAALVLESALGDTLRWLILPKRRILTRLGRGLGGEGARALGPGGR